MLLNIDDLKSRCIKIHYFGLGFIQLKVSESERYHFYSNRFPVTTTEEEIHNHRYDFESKVLKGTIIQDIFECQIDSEGSLSLTKESCKPPETQGPNSYRCGSCQDTFRWSTGIICPVCVLFCNVKLLHKQGMTKGSSYWIDHETFHRVTSENAITHLLRTPYKKELAEVIRPREQESACPFSVKISDDELWETVESMIL